MKKNYKNPECELLNFEDATMLHASSELNDNEVNSIIFGESSDFTGILFQ